MTKKEFQNFIADVIDGQICNVRYDLENFIEESSNSTQIDRVQLILDLISEAESLCDDIQKKKK